MASNMQCRLPLISQCVKLCLLAVQKLQNPELSCFSSKMVRRVPFLILVIYVCIDGAPRTSHRILLFLVFFYQLIISYDRIMMQ